LPNKNYEHFGKEDIKVRIDLQRGKGTKKERYVEEEHIL
jgi:hypothetical protein